MANPNSDASDEAKAVDAKAAKRPIDFEALDISIDRSRPVPEVHGEHILGYVQDCLPFDKAGRLHVPSLNEKQYERGVAALLRRVDRLAVEQKEAEKNPVKDTSNQQPHETPIETDPDAHINLVDWAKGKIKVQPHRIYNIAQRRLGKRYDTLTEVSNEMVKRKQLLLDEVKHT